MECPDDSRRRLISGGNGGTDESPRWIERAQNATFMLSIPMYFVEPMFHLPNVRAGCRRRVPLWATGKRQLTRNSVSRLRALGRRGRRRRRNHDGGRARG